MPNPDCIYCEGKGWYWVQDGPDDCCKEPCDCEYELEQTKEVVNGKVV